jgi:choline dehydrogenase-like flavoprotein
MRPFELSEVDRWLSAGAAKLGWSTERVPLAVNTVPHYGRAACVRCNACIGFTCPVDAKNGSHNAMIGPALATGLCDLASQSRAVEVTTDDRGRVVGVEVVTLAAGLTQRKRIRARAVVLAAGAVETARLLLLSRSRMHPAGIGNGSDHVGRHLQSHTYPIAMGVLPEDVAPVDRGPGVGISTLHLTHGNSGVIGGAMLANDFVKTPIAFWEGALPPGTPRWGAANKEAMRTLFGRVVDIRGPVHEIPSPDLRAQIDPSVRDTLGLPVARLSGQLHPETLRTAEFIGQQAESWLRASGATEVWRFGPVGATYHQAGTARMSDDSRDGVTDTSGRVHGHDNLFVADASVHPTNGSLNPALTVFALAIRTSANIVVELAVP